MSSQGEVPGAVGWRQANFMVWAKALYVITANNLGIRHQCVPLRSLS